MVINENQVIHIMQEEYMEVKGKMEAMTSRMTLAYQTSIGAFMGVEETYVWRSDPTAAMCRMLGGSLGSLIN